MSSLGNFFPKVRDPIELNDFFTINDCLQDDDSFLSRNSFDDPLTQIDCFYSSAAEFKLFPKTYNTYNFSTFCLNMRSLCNSKNLDNLKCVLESMNSYPTTIDRFSDDITMPIVWFLLQIVVKFAHLNQW